MDEFIQSIKQKFSMENIIETIRDELEETKKPKAEEINKVEPADQIVNLNEPTDKIINLNEPTDKIVDNPTKPSIDPIIEEMKKPSNTVIQKKQPTKETTNTNISVLQKPNQPEEASDPLYDTENLFSFCD